MVCADWLDLVAMAAVAGKTGIELGGAGTSTGLSTNRSGDGTVPTDSEGNSWWAGLDNWWVWLK